MHRTLCALATSVALVVALNVGAAAAGTTHSSPKPHGHGSIHDQANGGQDTQTGADRSAHGTLQFGPFASGSTDSGTCGNDWANDTFNRFFTVVTNGDGTTRVVEFFKDATFVTAVLPATRSGTISSPGACENGVNNGGLVTPGIHGRFQGYFLISVTGGTLNRLAVCDTTTPCDTTKKFIKTVFGVETYDVTTFLFNYSSSDKQLIQRHWKNASEDRGGNLGDIRTS